MRAGRALVAALAAACGGAPAATQDAPAAGPIVQDPKDLPEATCSGAQDPIGDLEWIPGDVRLAAWIDLAAPGVEDAALRLERAVAGSPGLPIVAALGLGQLAVQLQILRAQLARAGLQPRELVLLHAPDGAVLWVLRARCDLPALQATLARAWGLQSRTTASGPIAEPARARLPDSAPAFPYDALFLADDRLALVPAGAGGRVRRWLEAPPEAPAFAGVQRGPRPGEVLTTLPAAPIRGMFAGRGLLAEGPGAPPRSFQAWADRVELAAASPEPAPAEPPP